MLILHFLSALTVDMPSDVDYGVVGVEIELTCNADASLSSPTYEWYYKGSGTPLSDTSQVLTLTGNVANEAGDYQCTATAGGKTTAKSATTNLEFKSKSFLIHHLKDK